MHVSEADVLATHSCGEAEIAARMSSRKIYFGPSGGYCCKKRAGGVKITQLVSNSTEGLLHQQEINVRHTQEGQKKALRSQHLSTTTKPLPGPGSCCIVILSASSLLTLLVEVPLALGPSLPS